jgi:hypothetical protein
MDGVWEHVFTSEFASEIEKTTRTVSTSIRMGAKHDCADLASPGQSCLGCRFRPSCPAYRIWIPDQWSQGQADLPLDVAGIVESIKSRSEGLIDVRLIDTTHRHFRITAIPKGLLTRLPVAGDRLELYELNSAETGARGRYPRNFYIANPARPYASAFSAFARLFASGS